MSDVEFDDRAMCNNVFISSLKSSIHNDLTA